MFKKLRIYFVCNRNIFCIKIYFSNEIHIFYIFIYIFLCKSFFQWKIFKYKTFFPYKNIFFGKWCIFCKQHIFFQKWFFFNLVLQQMNNSRSSKKPLPIIKLHCAKNLHIAASVLTLLLKKNRGAFRTQSSI